jgi:hypothetical protein
MRFREWFRSGCDYRRKLLSSGLAGARAGGREFFRQKHLISVFGERSRRVAGVAAAGACIGAVGGYLRTREKSAAGAILFGMVGGAVGLGFSIALRNRGLASSVISEVRKSIGRVRDERWLEENPIDYA